MTYQHYFNPKIVGLIFVILAMSVGLLFSGVDEITDVSSIDDPRPTEPFKTPPPFIDTLNEGIDFVQSHISEVTVKMEKNSFFNSVVAERRWELHEFLGTLEVSVSLGEGKAAGEIVDYRVIAFIFDANGEYARGVTVIMNTNLEIIDIFDWPIMYSRSPGFLGEVLIKEEFPDE